MGTLELDQLVSLCYRRLQSTDNPQTQTLTSANLNPRPSSGRPNLIPNP